MKNLLNIFLIAGLISSFALAHDECEKHLLPTTKRYIIDGGISPEEIVSLEQGIEEIDQAARLLGINVPDHVLQFGSSSQLALLVANGGHASPHWVDGLEVDKARKNPNSVLEFVTDGCPACHSYYQTTTPLIQQLSIVMHVYGHNDFSKTSLMQEIRVPSNSTPASREMAEYMEELRTHMENWDEVTKYYQLLQSMKYDQDLVLGTYDSPKLLREKLALKKNNKDHFRPTASVLQALMASLPDDYPAWKKKMLSIFENREVWVGGAAQTKTINEGWATFLMFLLPKYTKYKKMFDIVEFMKLFTGVVGNTNANVSQGLGNPYWMGLNMWFNLYKDFKARPEIVSLKSDLEVDQKFVEYAHSIIATHNDQEFLMRGVTPEWVQKHKMLIIKTLEPNDPEFRPDMVPDEETILLQIVSNDFERIRRHIVRKYGDKGKVWPRILFHDDNRAGTYVLLKHDYEMSHGTPLHLDHAAAKLFVLTQVMEKPVAIDTIVPLEAIRKGSVQEYLSNIQMINQYKQYLSPEEIKQHFGDIDGSMVETRIIVFPGGDVRIGAKIADIQKIVGKEELDEAALKSLDGSENIFFEIQTPFQQYLAAQIGEYKVDLDANFHDKFNYYENDKFKSLLSTVVGDHVNNTIGILNSAPTAGAALLEYMKFMKARTARAIQLAMKGKINVQATAKGIKIPVLPIIPQFLLDSRIAKIHEEMKPKPPVDGQGNTQAPDTDDRGILIAMNELLGKFEGLPGDVFPYKPPKDGQGKGEGEGDPQDGEPQDGEPQEGAGQDSADPNFVEISWDNWLELIDAQLELRNVRQTNGKSKRWETVRAGSKTMDLEPYRHNENVKKAYAYGRGLLLKQGKSEEEIDMMSHDEIIKVGWEIFPKDKLVSYNWHRAKIPDFDAVVVFGIDLSISMQGEPIERAKIAFYNIKTYLQKYYKNIEFRFVVYDTKAYELPESKIWKAGVMGGTDNIEGVKKSIEILDEYSPAQYNRYFYFAGDGGDYGSEAPQQIKDLLRKIHDMTEASGYVETGTWGSDPFVQALKEAAVENEFFDYTAWTEKEGNLMDVILGLFGKEKRIKQNNN